MVALLLLLLVMAMVLYFGAVVAENENLISALTEDLLHSLALMCVYIPSFYATKAVFRVPTVRIAFFLAVAFMVLNRILDIGDEIPAMAALPFVGAGTKPYVMVKGLSELGAFLGPLAAFFLIIRKLSIAHEQLSEEIEHREREMLGRQRTEQALAESEKKFRTLAQTTSAAIFIVSGSRCLYTNSAAQGILGYSLEELNEQHFWERYIPQSYESIVYGTHRQSPQRFEIRAYTKRGDERWLDMTLGPMELHGERLVLGTAFDITERKQIERALAANEEWYRSLIKNSSDIFCVLRANGQISYIAASMPDVIGPSPEHDLTGQYALNYVHPDDRAKTAGFLAQASLNHGISPPLEVRVADRTGAYRTMEIVCNNLLDSRSIEGLVVNARDVSERKQLEEQLRQSQKLDALGRLAGGVAHDFNNVLTSIFVYTEVLEDRLRNHAVLRGKVHEIRKAAERAARLTRQLLAFSRHRVQQAQAMDLNVTVLDMYKMLECLIGAEVRLTTDLADDLECVVADPAHLEQVLLNLVLNARDAMPGGGTIEIATCNQNLAVEQRTEYAVIPPGSYVTLSIRDTGCGMDQATMARLFEPFFTTKQEGKGTGLGLATVYGILQQYQARIVVTSQMGHGSTFTVWFPHAELRQLAPAGDAPCANGETILIVEDDDEIRQLAVKILRGRGYATLEAAAPDEALRICSDPRRTVDLIVSDVIMPQMSGPTLIAAIREQRPMVRVLYISGYSNDSFLRMAAAEPPTGFLPKPFNADGLAARVREMLDVADRPPATWGDNTAPDADACAMRN